MKKVALDIPKQAHPVKTPTVLQMEGVECGAAALSIILSYFGKIVPLEKLRISCGVSRDGLKATNILKAAKEYGLVGKGYAKSVEKLMQVQMPVIIFWNFNHFLVLEGFTNKKVYLSDPAQGRYQVSHQEFDESFTGVTMTFQPGENFKKSNDKKGLIASLLTRIRSSKMSVVYIFLVSLFLIIPGLIIPSFTQVFIDKYLVNHISEFLMPLLLIMGGFLIVNSALVYLQQYYLLRLETKLALTTSSKFLWHVFHLPIAFFTQRYSGEIGNRVTLNDKVARLLSGKLANAALNVVVVVFFTLLMFSYNVLLTVIGLIIAALNILALQWVSRARKDGSRRLLNEGSKLLGTTMSGISMIETLKASGRESDFFKNWTGYLAKVMNAQQELGWLTTRLNIIPPLLMSLNSSIILGVGAMSVMNGEMSLGTLVAFMFLMNNFIRPVNELVNVGSLLQETEGDMNRIDDVLNYEIDDEFRVDNSPTDKNTSSRVDANTSATTNIIDLQPDTAHVPAAKLTGHIEIKNLSFGYSTAMPALIENFSLQLKPGSKVALVGGSGSGKSTIARILSGLYKPWSGEILFDGKRREDIPRHILNASIAVIDQDVLIFKGSVQENISFWDNTMQENTIIQSAHDAAIHDIIASRKNAYESEVTERGTNFSGGQRQRLEIARALALNPSILIMDEATSALDSQSEEIILDNIKKRGCTCLIVAHRLSTILDCDEIIFMQYGKIVERGHHSALMEMNGLYAKLISSK
jgi:NHLM bacteriocin system ABC transporter peptidase/ATP-binding protein